MLSPKQFVEFTDLQNHDVIGFSILHGQTSEFVANTIVPGIAKEKIKNNAIEEVFFVNTGFLQRHSLEMTMTEKSKQEAYAEALMEEEKWDRKLKDLMLNIKNITLDDKSIPISVSIENERSSNVKAKSNINENSIAHLRQKADLIFKITIDNKDIILIKKVSWSSLLIKEDALDRVRRQIKNKEIDNKNTLIADSDIDGKFKLIKALLDYIRQKSVKVRNAFSTPGGDFNSYTSTSFQRQGKEYDIEAGRSLANEYVFEEIIGMLGWPCTHYSWKENKVSVGVADGIASIQDYIKENEKEVWKNFPGFYKGIYKEELNLEELKNILKNISAFKIKNYKINSGISKFNDEKKQKKKDNNNKDNNSNVEGIERRGLGPNSGGSKQLKLSESKEFSRSTGDINKAWKEEELKKSPKEIPRPKARSAPASLANSPTEADPKEVAAINALAKSVQALSSGGGFFKKNNEELNEKFLKIAASALGVAMAPVSFDLKKGLIIALATDVPPEVNNDSTGPAQLKY